MAAHLLVRSESDVIRKLPGRPHEHGASSRTATVPTPASTMFFATCGACVGWAHAPLEPFLVGPLQPQPPNFMIR